VHYTGYVLGIVLQTGHDCKIMKNMRHPPAKMSSFDSVLNRLLIYVFIVNCIICFASAGIGVSQERTTGFAYLNGVYPSAAESFAQFFVQYFILYSYLIPISLNVTVEFLRLYHRILISWDSEFYNPEFGYATAHNSNQIGQLGLVRTVLSDKTGTLTENIMEMLKFATEHDRYDADDFIKRIEHLRELELPFLLALALCNNIIVHEKRDGTIDYNADSPDESAFVTFASKCGVKLIGRDLTTITLDICGDTKVYSILATLPFNSDRKRMSILVQAEGEPAILYCKGADNVISPRAIDFNYTSIVNGYTEMGLRTLVFSRRVMEEDELAVWLVGFREDAASLDDRDQKIEVRASWIECRLEVLGASGVEDRLQSRVPETIVWLRRAGIKIWILTGDKLETAVAIGKTSGVIPPGAHAVMVTVQQRLTVGRRLETIRGSLESFSNPVLVVTGNAVDYCLNDWLDDFMELTEHMNAIILSRVSPFMKAQVASTVRDRGGVTLAVGDGANDVGMIQVAHVGIGVYGREGSHAAQSSDFAVPRFRDLVRLLTVHDHWTVIRFTTVAMIMLYKNIMFILNQFWFSFDTLRSPTSLFGDFFLSVFNLVFIVVPPFAFGCCEQDLPEKVLLLNPELYPVFEDRMGAKNMASTVLLTIYQSGVSYYSARYTMRDDSLAAGGVVCYLMIVFIEIVQIMCWCSSQNTATIIAYVANILAVPLVIFVYMGLVDDTMDGVLRGELGHAYPWFGIVIALVAALLPGFIIQTVKNRFWPSRIRIWSERVGSESSRVKKDRLVTGNVKWTDMMAPSALDNPLRKYP
jgi:phospholipid-translocating P-type ATPase (flippase)